MNRGSTSSATLAGCLAIVFWGANIALSRSLSEKLGPFSAGAFVYLIGGLAGCSALLARGRLAKTVRDAHPAYLLGGGLLMVAYTASLFAAVGLAEHRTQVATATVANYLWPSLTLALSVPLLGLRARIPLLALGTLLGLVGVFLTTGATTVGQEALWPESLTPAGFGLLAALLWALYSNVARRWGPSGADGAMPLFLLATGLALLGLRTWLGEQSRWSPGLGTELAAMALFPTLLAYVLWDTGVRRGNLPLLASLSYLIPALSLVISRFYLDLQIGPLQWGGVALVIVAAALGQRAFPPPDRTLKVNSL